MDFEEHMDKAIEECEKRKFQYATMTPKEVIKANMRQKLIINRNKRKIRLQTQCGKLHHRLITKVSSQDNLLSNISIHHNKVSQLITHTTYHLFSKDISTTWPATYSLWLLPASSTTMCT